MNLWKHFSIALIVAVFLAGGTAHADLLETFAGQSGKIDIAGGTAHIPVMTEAAKRIMTVNPDIRINVEGGGTGVGVQKAGEGLVEIGNTGRALSEDEIAKYGLVSFAFAVDGVTVVLNPANGVKDLSAAQVQDIFAGKSRTGRTWAGPTRPSRSIPATRPAARAKCSGARCSRKEPSRTTPTSWPPTAP